MLVELERMHRMILFDDFNNECEHKHHTAFVDFLSLAAGVLLFRIAFAKEPMKNASSVLTCRFRKEIRSEKGNR
jgi:hypothetical protein